MKTDRSSVTKPNPRRARLNRGALVTSPLKRTSPAIGGSSPESVSRVVVFPAPLGPMSATTSPGFDPEIEPAHDRHAAVAGGQSATLEDRGGRQDAHSV